MSRSTVANYIKLSLLMFKTNLHSAMEYRISFIMQMVGMVVGDISFACVWIVFFKRFPAVHGWQVQDMMLLTSLSTISFGLFVLFADGTFDIARKVASGEFDYHLSLPQHALWNVSTGRTMFAGFGDLIFGVVLYALFQDLAIVNILLFLVLTLLTTIIFFNFMVITQSMAFFVGHFEEAAEQLWVALFFSINVPQGSFHGILKVINMTIIPGFFLAELPVCLMRSFNLWHLLGLLVFTLGTLFLAIFVFNKGLKRYESGSLINVKM